jgi:hypothetical protein
VTAINRGREERERRKREEVNDHRIRVLSLGIELEEWRICSVVASCGYSLRDERGAGGITDLIHPCAYNHLRPSTICLL